MASDDGAVQQAIDAMAERMDEVLGDLSAADSEWWRPRLHLVETRGQNLRSWLRETLQRDPRLGDRQGFGIDRFQRIRGIGGLADVNRFSSALNNAGQWPWEGNLAYFAHEAQYHNYRSDMQDMLDAEDFEVITLMDGDWAGGGGNYIDVELPDAATMATYDTLLVEVEQACDPALQEISNCGAWDYNAGFFVCSTFQDTSECGNLVARFITTYHREGRWLLDGSEKLFELAEGGWHTFRYDASGQSYFNTIRLHLGNRGKGGSPQAATYLYGGGGFNAGYNDAHSTPVVDTVPLAATRVTLQATITGHGFGNSQVNCAEFCDHQHHFVVNGTEFQFDHPMIGNDEGCLDQIPMGTVPNQNGTWWFGRGGWCPGKQVDPWVVDVTELVKPGEEVTVSYYATLPGYPDLDSGNIYMESWLVYSW
jgi:hypothetical protein